MLLRLRMTARLESLKIAHPTFAKFNEKYTVDVEIRIKRTE